MSHSQKLFPELPVSPGQAGWYRWTTKLPHFGHLRATVGACLLGLCTQSCVWMEAVSVDANGNAVGVTEEQSAISLDGRFVAFVTDAALLLVDNNGLADVYRRDMATANVTLVSVTPLGGSANAHSGEPDISDDGDRVAFTSTATDLGPTANGQPQVYVRTLSSETTVLASASVSASAGNGASTTPSMARDGSAVAFASEAGNLSPGDNNGLSDIFSYDITGAIVTRHSVGPGGSDANGASFDPASNADGSVIAFTSESSNLVTGDNNGVADIFTVSGAAIVRISQGLLGEANGPSGEPAIADTNAVVFSSDAGNLVADDVNGVTDVFFSPPGGPLERLSQNGAFGYSLPSMAPSVSANGTRVAFLTDGVNIDHPAGTTAVITDRVEGRVDALATAENSQPAVHASDVSLSADGAIASFSSTASLDANDTNAVPDIYTRFTYPAYIWPLSLTPGTVAAGSVTAVTLSGHGFLVGGPSPVIAVRNLPDIVFSDIVVVDAGTITAVMTVPASVGNYTYTLLMETPGNRADMDIGRGGDCLCLTVADPLPTGDLRDIGAEVGISGPDGPTTNVSVADFNGDSFLDILYLRHGATSIQLLGDGAGVEPVEIMPLARADRHECDSADVNNDGLIDIYCSVGANLGEGTGNNSLWLRRPDGGYTDVAEAWGVTDPYGRGRDVTFLHANNDGLPDLFVTNTPPRVDEQVSENHLFINNGGTGFDAAPEFGVDGPFGNRCAVTTDFDNDGDDDLVVCGNPVRMYANQDDIDEFVDVAPSNGFEQQFLGAAFADIDGDGDVDVAFSTPTQFAIHRLQNGVDAGQVFSYPTTTGHTVAFGEINGDGIPDAYFVQRGCRTESEGNLPDIVAVSKGAGWVVKHPPALNRGCGDGVAAFDHDGDGIDGFVVGNGRGRDGPLQYLVAPPPPGC